MAIFLSALVGLVLWIVLWAIGAKGFDAFMLTMLIVLIGCVVHIVSPHLPGNKPQSAGGPPPGA